MDIKQLAELAPGFDWGHALAASGVANKVSYVIVSQPSYLTGFNAVLEKTDLATWKTYFEWQLLREASPYLSKEFADAHFDFYSTVLAGVAEQPPRWKRRWRWSKATSAKRSASCTWRNTSRLSARRAWMRW
jgi:predicted metalloendopeptidase